MTVRTMAFSVRLRYATVRLVANGAQTVRNTPILI